MLVEIIEHEFKQGYFKVYKCYNEKQLLFEQNPICLIDEDKFCELLTQSQIDRLTNDMEFQFKINQKQLLEKSYKIY